MRRPAFKEATKDLKLNDAVRIHLRGYYENYIVTGQLFIFNEDFIGINEDAWHSYRKVISIKKM